MVQFVLNYSMENKAPITIIYQKGLEITQRNIKVIKIADDLIFGYCYSRKSTRNFKKEHILAAFNIHVTSSTFRQQMNI